jgi:hypothetical protein
LEELTWAPSDCFEWNPDTNRLLVMDIEGYAWWLDKDDVVKLLNYVDYMLIQMEDRDGIK